MANAAIGKHGASAPDQAASTAADQAADFIALGASPTPHVAGVAVPQRRRGRVAAIVAGSLLGACVLAYAAGVAVFSNVFYPNTTIGEHDISLGTLETAAAAAAQIGTDFTVQVRGEGLDFTVNSDDAGVTIDGTRVATAALQDNEPWKWPYEVFQSHDESQHLLTDYNASGLSAAVEHAVGVFNETADDPVNATVAFSNDADAFAVIPESVGTKVDPAVVVDAVDDAILSLADTATVDETALVQPTVFRDDPSLQAAADAANVYLNADIELVLGDDATHVADVSHAELAQWVTLNDDLTANFDQAALDDYLNAIAGSINSVGKQRTFTCIDGVERTVGGNDDTDAYGWIVDTATLQQQVRDQVAAGYVGQLRIPCFQEAYKWTGEGQVDWGRHVEINISTQHAWFVDADGSVLWESDVITGRPDGKHDTSRGVFRCTQRSSPYTMHGEIQQATGQPEYVTTCSYWMRFTNTGMGLHDATWQPGFGGSMYANGYGSHGCVNLPYSAAQSLYDIIAVNNAVIVYD